MSLNGEIHNAYNLCIIENIVTIVPQLLFCWYEFQLGKYKLSVPTKASSKTGR